MNVSYFFNRKRLCTLLLQLFALLLVSGCVSRPAQPPCTSIQQNIENCPPIGAILDEDVKKHQQSREWLPADKHTKDYLGFAMMADIPIQEARLKIIGTEHASAVESLATKVWLIDHAKYTIDLTYYIFTRDLSGYAILGALCNAAHRGVDIRIMVDSLGSYHTSHSELKALLNCNAQAGFRINEEGLVTTTKATIQAVVFNALTRHTARINRRSHDKLLIIDAAYANDAWVLTGGRNISNDYYGIDDDLNDDLSVFKDMEILLKPLKNSTDKDSVSQVIEYYYSILFSHKGNKKLTTWWSYNGQQQKAQTSLSRLFTYPKFESAYQALNQTIHEDLAPVKVRLAHEIGNLKSSSAVVSQYAENKKSNANSIMTILKKIGKEAPNLTHLKIVSPYLFLEEYLKKQSGEIKQEVNLAQQWLDVDPRRTLEIVTNSALTSDNFFTQAVIDMHTGPKLLLPKEIEKIWLSSDLDNNEYNPEFINSPQWKKLIANPRIKFYQLGQLDSVKLGGSKHYGKLHAKFIITDDIAFVGTSNFDFRSMLFNSEVGYFIHGNETLTALNTEFELLKSQSYLWGSDEWLALRKKIREQGGAKGFTTKTQRSLYKVLEKTGLKIQL